MHLTFMEGNEAVAGGAMYAGCRFFAGYPITPATTIYHNMLQLLPPAGGICMQGEDEIASIGYCLGASMAGCKVMTATSGPGISLYSENISFALGSEIPIVIVDVQRLGPSTGSATKGADGDIQFLQWGNSGGLPGIVLAPSDVRDCFVLTVTAFNLAEEFRCPVFLASNKEIAMSRESVDTDSFASLPVYARRKAASGKDFLPFSLPGGQYVPDFLPIGGPVPVRQTSSTHGPDGYITTSPEIIADSQKRLRDKLISAADRICIHEEYTAENAETLIISYGVTARSAKALYEEKRKEGPAFSLLHLKSLWPVPENTIRRIAGKYERILVAEMNLGQYVREMQRILPGKEIRFLGQMNGQIITPQQIGRALEK
ncbi:MAG: transketolase C-terminal domain-containing protein [Desulfococcaceae bacterium]|jgi:2-oxoglutarate ferredoxin oxidoreductase subunit alpha|nr:transketolase C-terminal domain-containing protein [Desulfococcaceae bacterium]